MTEYVGDLFAFGGGLFIGVVMTAVLLAWKSKAVFDGARCECGAVPVESRATKE